MFTRWAGAGVWGRNRGGRKLCIVWLKSGCDVEDSRIDYNLELEAKLQVPAPSLGQAPASLRLNEALYDLAVIILNS